VGGELDKLAFNTAFGRDTAGVHFRNDELEGIVLAQWQQPGVIADSDHRSRSRSAPDLADPREPAVEAGVLSPSDRP
jgi:hypothetical protein